MTLLKTGFRDFLNVPFSKVPYDRRQNTGDNWQNSFMAKPFLGALFTKIKYTFYKSECDNPFTIFEEKVFISWKRQRMVFKNLKGQK
jgi:hypothetical protein